MKQAAPLTFTNARLVLPGGVRNGALRCIDGRISTVGDVAAESGDEVIEGKGLLLAPGLIDFGVFAVAKPAFHFGGITRAALLPDQSPPLDHPARVRFLASRGKPDLGAHPLAAATMGRGGAEIAELALMREAGANAVAT